MYDALKLVNAYKTETQPEQPDSRPACLTQPATDVVTSPNSNTTSLMVPAIYVNKRVHIIERNFPNMGRQSHLCSQENTNLKSTIDRSARQHLQDKVDENLFDGDINAFFASTLVLAGETAIIGDMAAHMYTAW